MCRLVGEEIDAGAKLAAAFAAEYPLRAAFWLKRADRTDWDFCLVPAGCGDASVYATYSIVHRNLDRRTAYWLDSSQVRLIAADAPLARGVLDRMAQAGAEFPIRLRTTMVGPVYAEDGYVYPVAAAA